MLRAGRFLRAFARFFWATLAFVAATVAVGMLVQAAFGSDPGATRLAFAGAGLVLLTASYLTYRAHPGGRMPADR
jgi:hypothetical protein